MTKKRKTKYEEKVVELVEEGDDNFGLTEGLMKAFPELGQERALQIIWGCVDKGFLVFSSERTFVK